MWIIDEMKKARAIIESHGYTILEEYTLISNYGIVFTTDGINRVDARHWINCYGCECNHYDVTFDKAKYPELEELKPEFKTIQKELNDMIWGN